MEEEMEVELFYYEAREVDPDYEFDAPMFFDFSREETFAEALLAERWFGAASSYPPSPFVAKLVLREEIMLQNINTSPKPKGAEYMTTSLNDEDGGALGPESAAVGDDHKGFIFYNHILSDKFKAKENPLKPKSRGCSTLMRPTASLLAKQIRAPHVGGSRFQMALDQKGKSIPNSSMVENQAAKRQKLEGGHLRKVGDANPQTDFLHKAPAKLRITIPREPDFETAHRAHRTRPMITSEFEHTTVAVRRFKARPLNRKILEAPSLPIPKKSTPRLPEFHILSSKGDIGVFRNSKRQTTVPMMQHVPKGRPSGGFGGKQIRPGSNGCNSDVGNQYGVRYAAEKKELGHPVRRVAEA
ncbi:unnamed protein product [Linum tenue]|uniref:TPX2 central domain-containing protein n=1 Tax=Linum tenue TaxID=586396 RepID=A0AAV0K6M3_9ROSI|nr:unnamed protein product [Linum tenue]